MIELVLSDGVRCHRLTCGAMLFDMDGTLVDSSKCIEAVWRTWAARHSLDAEALLDAAPGRETRELIRLVAPHLDTADEMAALTRASEEWCDPIVAIAGAPALLRRLHPNGWAVVTSAWRRLAELRLRRSNLPVPSVLVTADDVERGKPHPDGFLKAAALLGVAPAQCVVFEDARAGIQAGRVAGMTVVGIATTLRRGELDCELCIDDFRSVEVSA
jgi:sugar-phosphatase